ncbi:polyphosphate kinase 2 [candidate division KSB1 bacterium]|nr:polyphosphate kinase 2 [candidate division KSB1 bacterium]
MSYKEELRALQLELVKLQKWVQKENKRILIIFEGRDTAGKGGAIRRFMRFLNPRTARAVALSKPTDRERGQWYFQRYIKELPSTGEIVFFDRSWYNRGVVEPVMGFCSNDEYKRFLRQVPKLERMLWEDGIILFKLYFSIDINEQKKRLRARGQNPFKQWKLSTMDMEAQRKWHEFTRFKEFMFEKTHRDYSPWVLIDGNDKQRARLESIRYVVANIEYKDKGQPGLSFEPDRTIIAMYNGNH